MSDIQEKILELMDLFDEDEVTTADKINRPEPKQSVKQIELFNEFNIRNPKAGGGMLVKPSVDGSRPGYAKDNVGGEVGAKEVKDFKTNINNWTKNWIKENINNYNIRESDKFIKDLKKAWAKESKNKKYKVVGVDFAKGRVLTQNGFPAVSTNKAVNSFNIFGYEMPGGIKTKNIGNAQRNLYSKIFFTNILKNNASLRKKLNFYFDYITADKRGTNANSLSKKVTNIMAKAGVTDPKELLDKDVIYLLSKDSGMGDKARYEFFINNYGNKYINYRNKVDSMHGDYMKNVRILKDKFNINVKGQLNKENNALKKIFNVDDLPFELRYSGDHLFGVSQAAKSNNKKFAIQAVNNLVGMTREQNKILGLGEFEKTRKNLISKINTAKVRDKTKLLTELNNLMKSTYQDYFGKKQNYYDLDKGKVTISKNFVPLSQEERFTQYFKQIGKTKEGRAAIKKQYGNLQNLLKQLKAKNVKGVENALKQTGVKGSNAGFISRELLESAAKGIGNVGRVLAKYGILPEVGFLGGDYLIRTQLGDSPKEAFLRASDFYRPEDQTKEAEILETSRFFGDKAGQLVGRVIDYEKQLAKIENLKQQKQSLENLTPTSDFSYLPDTSQGIKNIDDLIKQATLDLNNKFNMTEAERTYANRIREETDDARMATSNVAKTRLERSQSPNYRMSAPQAIKDMKSQTDLDLNMFPSPATIAIRDPEKGIQYKNLSESSFEDLQNYRQLLKDFNVEPPPTKLFLGERDRLRGMLPSEAAEEFGAEQAYGASGTFFGQPLAGGGIAKIAGIDQGPPPESGPNSQGLKGLFKRAKNI